MDFNNYNSLFIATKQLVAIQDFHKCLKSLIAELQVKSQQEKIDYFTNIVPDLEKQHSSLGELFLGLLETSHSEKPLVQTVVARDLDKIIGIDGSIYWNLPLEMKKFVSLTKKTICIMGGITYNSFRHDEQGNVIPLSKRLNLVVTRKAQDYYQGQGIEHCPFNKQVLFCESYKQAQALCLLIEQFCRSEELDFELDGFAIQLEQVQELVNSICRTLTKIQSLPFINTNSSFEQIKQLINLLLVYSKNITKCNDEYITIFTNEFKVLLETMAQLEVDPFVVSIIGGSYIYGRSFQETDFFAVNQIYISEVQLRQTEIDPQDLDHSIRTFVYHLEGSPNCLYQDEGEPEVFFGDKEQTVECRLRKLVLKS